MAENKFTQFIPPQLRGPATDVGIFGRVASDNILGFLDNYFLGNRFDDDYESTGEMLGTAFREQPIETGKALGTGIYEAGKSVYEDPKAAFGSALEGLEGVFDRLNTPYDQLDLSTEEAQRERAGDLAILGEALSGTGIITKSLAKVTKKQLREKVIQDNPGLNEDQVNSIVEDRGYDPNTYISPQLDPFRDVYDPIDDGRRSPALEGDFIGDPTSEIDQAYNRGELVPIVTTAGGRVIGTANPNIRAIAGEGEYDDFFDYGERLDEDVDGNLYGPPDEVTLSEIIADQNAYFESLLDEEARFDRLGNELTDDADIIDRAIQIHSEEGFPDLDPGRERLIREELDRVLDAQRAFDENNPPEIEDLMEPSENLFPPNYLTDARVGQELSLPYGEARNQQIVDLSDMSNDFTTLNLANFPTEMVVNGERVDIPPFTNLDEDAVRLRTIRDVGDRYVIGYQDVDSRGRDVYTGEQLEGATEIDDLVNTLRERFDNIENDTTYGTSTTSVINNSVREWMERIETNSLGDETPFYEYAVIPPNYTYEDNAINVLQFTKDYLQSRGLSRDQAGIVALQIKRRARENENRADIRAEQEYGDYEGDAAYYEEYDPVITGEGGYDPANPDPDYVPDFNEAAYNRSRYIDRAGGYNQPGYESFAEQINIDLTAKKRDPLEVEAGDVSLTGGSSALSSKLDDALDDLKKTQTKFPSLNQLIKTLENKYGIKEAEFEARNMGSMISEFGDQPIDLKSMSPFGLDPFVIRTLDGADVSYRDYFTKGATNYKETLITLKNPSLLSLGAGDNKHYQYAQTKMQAPLVVHMRTGNFPMAPKPGENVKKKTFHLGEIQSQGTQDATISRKLRRSVEQFTEDLLNPFADGKFVGLYGETKPFDIADVLEDLDKVRVLEDRIADLGNRQRLAGQNFMEVEEYLQGDGSGGGNYGALVRQGDQARADLKAIKDKYMVFDAETGRTDESSYLDQMEPGFREILKEQKLIKKNGSFKIDSLNSAPDFHSLVVNALNESERINADDMGVGSLFNQKQILPLAIKESLQQAANSDSDFFTLGSPEMVKKMTFGELEGQEEYYSKFVPKAFDKVMEQLEKQNDVKLPRLSEQIIETFDDDGKTLIEQKVLGIEITDELREVFKSGKVQAFKEGGLATISSSLRPKLRPGTLEALKEQIKRDKQTKEFADFEYRADMEPQLSYNPIARLGYDPDKHRVVRDPAGIPGYRQGYRMAQYQKRLTDDPERNIEYFMNMGLSREDAERISEDDIITSDSMTFSPVIAHEFTHRGFDLLREERNKDPEAFDKKYGKHAGNILRGSNFYDGLEEYYVEMFDDLDTRFNSPGLFMGKTEFEDFPTKTGKFSIQSSPEGPYKDLDLLSPEQAEERFEQIRAFQDGVLNLNRFRTQGILGLMDAAQDILIERGEIQAKPRIYYDPSYRKRMQQKQTNSKGGLVNLAKEVL